MSKSVNRVTLLGNVGQPPEIRTTGTGLIVANLSVATNERVKQGNEWKDHTEWHRLTFFGRLAEVVRDYVKKGSKIYCEGKLRTTSWDDKGTTRYSTGITADELILLDGAPDRPPTPPPDAYSSDF
jgi:single-strand DNA-binding protein